MFFPTNSQRSDSNSGTLAVANCTSGFGGGTSSSYHTTSSQFEESSGGAAAPESSSSGQTKADKHAKILQRLEALVLAKPQADRYVFFKSFFFSLCPVKKTRIPLVI